jgi:hypothetical protein
MVGRTEADSLCAVELLRSRSLRKRVMVGHNHGDEPHIFLRQHAASLTG